MSSNESLIAEDLRDAGGTAREVKRPNFDYRRD